MQNVMLIVGHRAHNGLVHVLDAVLQPLNSTNAPTASGSATASSTASKTAAASSGAASPVDMGSMSWTLMGLLGSVAIMEGLGIGTLGVRLLVRA